MWKNFFSGFGSDAAAPDGAWTRLDLWCYVLCAVAGAVMFQHFDLFQTAPHGVMVYESLARGEFLNFYAYTERASGFGAAYNIVFYLLLALWGLPVFLYNLIAAAPLPLWCVVSWYKLLLLFFGFLSAVELLRVGRLLGLAQSERRLLLVLFITSPLLFWQLVMLGQYDIFSLFFTLVAFEFLIRRQLLRFCVAAGIAACFKNFALLVFLPLILLEEKRLLRLAIYALLAAALPLIPMLPFASGFAASGGSGVSSDAVGYLFASILPSGNAAASLFWGAYILLCLWAYGSASSDHEMRLRRCCYAPLAVFSALFAFSKWHPQWLILIVPYALLNLFVNVRGDRKVLLLSDAAFFFGAVGITVINWTRGGDHQTLRNSILGNFDTRYFSQALEMADVYGAGAPFTIFYSSLMFAILAYYLWRCRPADGERSGWRCERWTVFFRFAAVLFFVIPALAAFFYSGHCERRLLSGTRIDSGELLWVDPEEKELYGTGREVRSGTFDVFLRSRHPVWAPAPATADRSLPAEVSEGMVLRMRLGAAVSPLPRAVGIYCDGFAATNRYASRFEFRAAGGGEPYVLMVPHNLADGARYVELPLPPGLPPPYDLTVRSDAPAGSGLKFRFIGGAVPDSRWPLDNGSRQ